jgi:hypothetical protein
VATTAKAWWAAEPCHAPSERRKIVKTVRLNHLRAALLAAAAAGLLAAVALLVVVLYAQPAEANFPGTPGRIAYSSSGEIFTIKPNGGGRVPVTPNATNAVEPAYSPSGKRIAYSSGGEIFTIKPDGGGKRQVTPNATNAVEPAYSPSGKRIAYEGQDGPMGDDEIFTIKPDGGGKLNVTQNTATDDGDPYWGSQ